MQITCLEFLLVKNAKIAWREKNDRECGEKCHDSTNELINKFLSIYQFFNGDLNKFILLLRKGVYPYEGMDNWEKLDKTTIPPKETFYSKLNLEGIYDVD